MPKAMLPACLFWGLWLSCAIGEEPLSFATDVQPILTKQGCNQGACHGSQFGKGGFKLSLRGFDDPADYFEIVKAAHGRRVVTSDPSLSLFLLKPTNEIPHQGGKRLDRNSRAYKVLEQWIEQGAAGPAVKEPQLTQLLVTPKQQTAKPGGKVRLTVKAVFDNGEVEDVAERASFDSGNPGVATAGADGMVDVVGRGEAAIMVRFLDRVSVCRIISPYSDSGKLKGFEGFKPSNKVDELWLAKWKQLGLAPAAVCSDAEFLRRVFLDVLGTAPRSDEVLAFLADKRPDRREKLIDAVLERPEYVDYWTYKWGDLLRNNRNLLQEKGMWSFHHWLRAAFRDNMPFDQFVNAMLTATGSPFQEGPANFYRVGRQPEDWSENACQVFLGVRVQCARCHHHPFENISQADYFGMTAFFARVGSKRSQEFGIYGQDAVVFVRETGDVRLPRSGKIARAIPLGGKPIPAEQADPFDRRRDLAKWLSDPKNPALAKNVVNRYWGYLFGRGLVHPIDDIRVTNPASSPEVFDYLVQDLIAHHYDVKHLLRTMLRSRTYQLASVGDPASEVDGEDRYFTRYSVKRLTAEQMLDAVDYACGTQEQYAALPAGYRAISLPDTNVNNKFLDVFGRPRREIACECERTDTPNMSQALELLTGGLINRKVQDPAGRIAKLLKAKTPPESAVRELYLSTMCRPPSESEVASAVALIKTAPTLKEGLEDFLWAMLNSREFQFNR